MLRKCAIADWDASTTFATPICKRWADAIVPIPFAGKAFLVPLCAVHLPLSAHEVGRGSS